jgi:AI-2 transport protein TqsA
MAIQSESQLIGPVATGILVLALLHFAQAIFVPLAFSLFLIALVYPIQSTLQQRLPRLIALLFTVMVAMAVIVAIGSSVTWGFSKLGQWLFANAGRFQLVYTSWTDWLEGHGIAVAGVLTDRFDVNWLVRFTQGIAGRVNNFAGFALLVLVLTMLGLLEVDDFNKRLNSPAAQPRGAQILLANREIGIKLRRFMIVRTFASLLTGLVVWMFALAAGLELAAAWGAIAFTLNYIPFLGPFVATVLPTLFAIGQFESLPMAIGVFVGLNLIQFIIGSYLEPWLIGTSLSISPFAVIFAVFFWSFMWGVPGAFIGVPLLIAFIVYCSRDQSSRWIAVLASGKASDVTGQ